MKRAQKFSVLLEEYLSHREMRSLMGRHRQWDAVLDENGHLEELAEQLDAIIAKAQESADERDGGEAKRSTPTKLEKRT